MILIILSLVSIIGTTLSPILSANTIVLSLEFERTFTDIALLTGYHLLGVAVAGILFVPTARVWGKRHLYVLGHVIIIFSSAWAGAATSYRSILWARIFQGIGLAPYEALVNASVGDLYYVHERGKRMALSNLALFGGAFFTPVIVGRMTAVMGWEWPFYFVSIFAGVLLPFLFFCVPETAFKRDARLNTDTAVKYNWSDPDDEAEKKALDNGVRSDEKVVGASYSADAGYVFGSGNAKTSTTISSARPPARDSLLRRLRLFNGRKTDDSFFRLFLRPFPLFLHPSIFWACLIQGTLIGWTVFIGIVLATVFFGPPLFFDMEQTGYLYTGAFIGAIVGFVISGLITDPTTRWMTRRNGGVYEPEFRLVLVIPQLVLGCAGLYGFGITSADVPKFGWFWPDFFFALEVAGMVLGAVAAALYIVDAHRMYSSSRSRRHEFTLLSSSALTIFIVKMLTPTVPGDIAIEAFTCMLVFKNCFSFALSWEGLDWISEIDGGIERLFVVVGSVQVGVCLLTIPLCK